MIAIEIREPGEPDALVPVERPRPVPGSGEVLIKVAAAGVNRPDVMQRKGQYPPPPGDIRHPGLGHGTVEAIGQDVTGWREATRYARSFQRRVRRVLRGARAAMPPGASRFRHDRRRGDSRDLLHRLDQRLRSRPARGRRIDPGPRRLERHRYDRDSTRACARRARVRDRRIGGEVRRLRTTRRERAINYRETDFVAAVRELARPRCGCGARHGGRRLFPAQHRGARDGGAARQIATLHGAKPRSTS